MLMEEQYVLAAVFWLGVRDGPSTGFLPSLQTLHNERFE